MPPGPPNQVPPGLQSPAVLAQVQRFSGPSQLPPVTLFNFLDSATPGTTVTTGNSSGPGSTAFDVVTLGSGAAATYDNTFATPNGHQAVLITTGGTAALAFLQWSNGNVGNQSQMWYRFYLYAAANPSASTRLFRFETLGGAACSSVILQTTGHLKVDDSTFGQITNSANAIPLNQWIRVEGYVTGSGAAGATELKYFTSPETGLPTETNTSAAGQKTAGPIGIAKFGVPTTTANVSYRLAGLAVSNQGYIGPIGAQATTTPSGTLSVPGFMSPMALARPVFFPTAPQTPPPGQAGPPVYPLQGPVAPKGRGLPPRGRCASNPGTFAQSGPPVTPLEGPVAPKKRGLPPRGRCASNPGIRAQAGPPVTPLQGPVRSRIPQRPRGGHCASNPGIRAQTGPPVTPLQGPVRSRLPGPYRSGRCASNPGTFISVGPPVYPLHGPVRSRIPQRPRGGRCASNPGGPVLAPPPPGAGTVPVTDSAVWVVTVADAQTQSVTIADLALGTVTIGDLQP